MPTDELDTDTTPPGKGLNPWSTRASAADAAGFAEGLAALTRTGLPLPSGLRALGSEMPSRRLRATMGRMADRLESGASIDAALVAVAGRFPPQLRGLIAAGSRSGRLAEVLGRYSEYAGLAGHLRRRFWMAVGYPLFLLSVLGLLYLFVCFYVVEVFEFILKDFGLQIPAISTLLFLTARLTRESGAAIATAVALLMGVGLLTFQLLLGPADRRKALTGIPLLGPLLRWGALAEFCHLAGLLVEAEMPLPPALELAGRGSGDAELAQVGDGLRLSVEAGRTLSGSLSGWPRCPAGLFEVLDGSEGRGDLASALHMAGDMFEARARAQASFASALFATITLMLLFLGMAFVILALYLPILHLFLKLSG